MSQIKIIDIVLYHMKKEFNLSSWPQVKGTRSAELQGSLELNLQQGNLL